MRIALPVLALAAFAVPAFAQDAETAKEDTAVKADVPVVEKQVCKNIRTDMSSRRTERVCMTKKQWTDFERRSRN